MKYKCMYCGKWHKNESEILRKHIHEYYKIGGTIDLDKWKVQT